MKNFKSLVLAIFLVSCGTPLAYSFEKQYKSFKIDDINVRVFDRSTNQVFPLSELPNHYGLDMDLLVSVKVIGVTSQSFAQLVPRQKVTLSIDAPGYMTAATGDVPPWQENHTRSVFISSKATTSYLPFIVEYQCYPHVIFTASTAESTKSETVALPCAE